MICRHQGMGCTWMWLPVVWLVELIYGHVSGGVIVGPRARGCLCSYVCAAEVKKVMAEWQVEAGDAVCWILEKSRQTWVESSYLPEIERARSEKPSPLELCTGHDPASCPREEVNLPCAPQAAAVSAASKGAQGSCPGVGT